MLRAKNKRGGRPFIEDVASTKFAQFLQVNCLMDLGFVGPRFTWYNNQFGGARVWERIDRTFATPKWLLLHPEHQVCHIPRIASDHYPILLTMTFLAPYHAPFRFEKVWLAYRKS